jgi:hypothetical protein
MARLPALLHDHGVAKVCAAWFGAVKLAAAQSELCAAMAPGACAAYRSPKIF